MLDRTSGVATRRDEHKRNRDKDRDLDGRKRNKEKRKEMKGCQSATKSVSEMEERAKEKRDAIAERGRKLERKKKTET